MPRKRHAEDRIKLENEENEKMQRDKMFDLQSLEQKVNGWRDPGSFETSVKQYKEQIKGLETLRREQLASNISTKEAVLSEFNTFMQKYADFMEYQAKSLQALKEHEMDQTNFYITLSKEDTQLLSSD